MDQTGRFAASSWLVRQVARFALLAPSVRKVKMRTNYDGKAALQLGCRRFFINDLFNL